MVVLQDSLFLEIDRDVAVRVIRPGIREHCDAYVRVIRHRIGKLHPLFFDRHAAVCLCKEASGSRHPYFLRHFLFYLFIFFFPPSFRAYRKTKIDDEKEKNGDPFRRYFLFFFFKGWRLRAVKKRCSATIECKFNGVWKFPRE